MLDALSAEGAEYLVIGGYAVGVHAEPRATKALDIFIRPSRTNATRVMRALDRFGAARLGLTVADLATPGLIFQIGLVPRRIDIINEIHGVDFDDAWRSRIEVALEDVAAPMHVIGRDALVENKRSSGRPQDLADVAMLEATNEHAATKRRAPKGARRRSRKR